MIMSTEGKMDCSSTIEVRKIMSGIQAISFVFLRITKSHDYSQRKTTPTHIRKYY